MIAECDKCGKTAEVSELRDEHGIIYTFCSSCYDEMNPAECSHCGDYYMRHALTRVKYVDDSGAEHHTLSCRACMEYSRFEEEE